MVSTTGMVVSLKTDLRFPESGQQGHGAQIIHFERIYTILVELQFENCEIWLSSFVAYMMVSKAGLIIESQRCNNLFSKLNVEKLYPGFFETSCMVSGIEDWVCCGD